MPTPMVYGRLWAVLGAALLLAGCSQGPKVVPVEGTAMVDGKPLAGFSVHYVPDAGKGHTIEMDCSARIGDDGRYSIFTDDRYNQYDGAPPGWYRVTIGSPDDKPIPIDPKYLDIKTALSIEVKPDAPPGAYDLKFTK